MSPSSQSEKLLNVLIRALFNSADEAALFKELESLQKSKAFPGLTWYWGPELYKRNRLAFLPLILNHFSCFDPTGFSDNNRIPWEDHADRLEPWLEQVRQNRDTPLAKKLVYWQFSKDPHGIDSGRFTRELLSRYKQARGKVARYLVLEEFDHKFPLTEAFAQELYQTDPLCADFLHKHFLGEVSKSQKPERKLWKGLFEAAKVNGDLDLAFSLYRSQVDRARWKEDAEKAVQEISDPQKLNEQLCRLHPSGRIGEPAAIAEVALSLLKQRGKDLYPYVSNNFAKAGIQNWGPFVDLAKAQGWINLWVFFIGNYLWDEKERNRKILELFNQSTISDHFKKNAIISLATKTGFYGYWIPYRVDDENALKLYQHNPQLLKTLLPFIFSYISYGVNSYSQLLNVSIADKSDWLIEGLTAIYGKAFSNGNIEPDIQTLTSILRAILQKDPTTFARKVARILTLIPTTHFTPSSVLPSNSLARLLFVESLETFLGAPDSVNCLIESSREPIRNLGFCILAKNDNRARWLAVQSLDILLATLRMSLDFDGRKMACRALANAAKTDPNAAEIIFRRARECLKINENQKLITHLDPIAELIGQILALRPGLQSPREKPVVYGPRELVP